MPEKPKKPRKDPRRCGPTGHGRPTGRSPRQVRARPVPGEQGVWELVHPRCALERADDIEEVRAMIKGDEVEIAVEELRWLLGGCNDFIDAHLVLGELALADEDVELARGHFGIAFHLGVKAAAGLRGTFPYSRPDNQAFLESGKGLIACLLRQEKLEMARDVVHKMLRLDPSDPLGVKGLVP